MPGRLFLTAPPEAVSAVFGPGCPPLEPRLDMAPGEPLLVVTADGYQSMRWGLIPVGRKNARGRPVMETIVNARSETVLEKSAFAGTGRAVVPASGWYEWTGARRKKTRWRIARRDGALLAMAAITDLWQGPGGVAVAQMATVTAAPNADVAAYHHRMPVLLERAGIAAWLGSDAAAAAAVLQTPEPGTLAVEAAEDVMALRGH